MKDVNTLCTACMNDKGLSPVCSHCGFNSETHTEPLHHLKAGTILNGKYWVGNAIGEGGFGITYIGYDLNLEIKVAIKEYFPNGFVSRDVSNTDTVTIFSGSTQEVYEQGREKFINEAKALAKFDNFPGIVSVKDFFMENGTAYIVMEYIEGETLKDFLKRNGGKTSPENIFEMIKPLMSSLAQVHKQGLIHRDISPDNIMITGDMRVKLLDFGSARDVSTDGQKSMSIQLKPGYAPEEQYRSHGKQGPWTDVYALCATIYHAITGVQPVESLERLQSDPLVSPSALGVVIDSDKEAALMRGLAVFANQRIQSVDELYSAFYNGVKPKEGPVYNQPPYASASFKVKSDYTYTSGANTQQQKSNLPVILALAAGGFVLVLALAVMIFVISGADLKEEPTPTPTVQSATPAPTQKPKPVFTKVEASSTRSTDMTSGAPVEYFPTYAVDGDYTTTWSPDRNVSLNPTFTLYADTKQYVTGIKMSNGYFKTEETYTRNRRITQVKIEYEGGEKIQSFGIDQYRVMQDIRFDAPANTSYIKIHVLDSYYGDWKDLCISEIEVY